MKKILLLTTLFSTLSFINIKAQVIPEELLGEWSFQYELDYCQNIISSGCDIVGLNISQYNNNTNLDTLLITEFKESNESYSARYHLTMNTGFPEQFFFVNLDSTTAMNPFLFLSTYDSDSLIFNWTTTDPGAGKYFKLISPDSLVFHWYTNCLACHCSGAIHFSRIQTTNSTSIVSDSDAWKIYPNPAQSYISLEKPETQDISNTRISLIDSKGSIHKEIVTSEFNFIVSLANLHSGLFYLKIEDQNGITLKKLVIID